MKMWDWQRAARLRSEGMTYDEIAAACGVSRSSVFYALNPRERKAKSERQRNPRAVRRMWTESDAIAALQTDAAGRGRTATCVELRPPLPTQRTLERLFGSINGAMTAAGLPTRGRGRPARREAA